jgi:hypothetical protein
MSRSEKRWPPTCRRPRLSFISVVFLLGRPGSSSSIPELDYRDCKSYPESQEIVAIGAFILKPFAAVWNDCRLSSQFSPHHSTSSNGQISIRQLQVNFIKLVAHFSENIYQLRIEVRRVGSSVTVEHDRQGFLLIERWFVGTF